MLQKKEGSHTGPRDVSKNVTALSSCFFNSGLSVTKSNRIVETSDAHPPTRKSFFDRRFRKHLEYSLFELYIGPLLYVHLKMKGYSFAFVGELKSIF